MCAQTDRWMTKLNTNNAGATPPPSTAARHDVTLLLDALAKGDSHASSELLPLVYDELRKLAHVRMNKEPGHAAGYTLEPTALVHEAYLRLVGASGDLSTNTSMPSPLAGHEAHGGRWDNRGHFFAAAALAMRRILVERARAQRRLKRGGDGAAPGGSGAAAKRVELRDDMLISDTDGDELISLDAALDRLQQKDERKYRVVMLRYFAGLSIDETAAAIGISPATVKNDWAFARAWLHREVASDQSSPRPEPGA
jgi:RNA polymerase sigma factor (TIGR02999 family)